MITERIFDAIVLFLSLLTFLISSITLILIFVRIRPIASNIPIILTCNTYITLIGSSLMTLVVTAFGIYNTLQPSVSFNDFYCQLRSYINYVFICAFYYSCALQAIFRLFQVVFSKHRILQSNYVLIATIVLQWIIPIFYILAYLLLNDFEYHPEIGSCWLSAKNIKGLSTAMAFIYGTPLIIMCLIYILIIRHIRHTSQTTQSRQNANKRDLLVVKRIMSLVLIGMGIGIPTAFMLIIYMITSYLPSLAYHIQALSLTIGFAVESIALGIVTPQVREIFRRNTAVHSLAGTENGEQGTLKMRTVYNEANINVEKL